MTGLSRDDIEHILVRYFLQSDRSPEIVTTEEPLSDAGASAVDRLLKSTSLHDDDYVVFGHFTEPNTTILDIGANFGYSATAIWQVGSQASVASFEPIRLFDPILKELGSRINASAGYKKFEHYNCGLSDKPGNLIFHCSVINGRMNSALTTASSHPNIKSYVDNTFYWAERNVKEINTFQLYSFSSPVSTVDIWINSKQSQLPVDRIVAIKIDAEGHEGHILLGGAQLLERQKPLIMAESGHSIALAVDTAAKLGYVLAERDGNQLIATNRKTSRVNGFFIHPDNFAYYQSIGLMSK